MDTHTDNTTIKDESTATGSNAGTSQDELEGYITNITDINNGFAFDVRGKRKCARVISFSPGKKSRIEELLKSPVKIAKLQKGRYQNFILDDKSPIKQTTLDYAFEDEEIHIGNMSLFGNGSLANFTVQVKSVEKERMNRDRNPFQSVVVSEKNGSTKLFLYGSFVNSMKVGLSYTLHNVRLMHDSNGGSSTLMTPKEGCVIKRAEDFTGVDMVDPSLKGEICTIDYVKKYPTCMKCNKKIQNIKETERSYDCSNPKCKATMKKKFANTGILVKFMFISEDNQKRQMTMFQDELSTIVPNATSISEEQIKNELLAFDEIKICVNNSGIMENIFIV